ncbi:MAG: tetratricopeptide repeat protein [Acidobacteria bacterium]|nr:tetratricopeptide repeat protein [Acidobacteriota bacterium]
MTSCAAHPRVLVIASVSLALMLSGPAAPSAQDGDSAPVLAQARLLINQGRPQEAIEKLTAPGVPRRPEVSHLLGVAYYHADDHLHAIEQLMPLLDRWPEGSLERREAVQVLGLSYFVTGRFAEAVPFLEATRIWASENAELGYVLGQAYVQTRQPDRARETFARTFGVTADSGAAHLLAAQMMIRLEFESSAEAELKRAIEKDPKLPQAHILLGQIALFRGRLDEAVALTEREIALNPASAMAFSQLGDAWLRQSKWDEGIAALQKSVWLNPFYSAPYILLGKAYMKKGQPATAEGMLSRAIQYDPNNRSAHYLLGQLLQQMGRHADAKRHFDIAERLQGQPGR